MCKFEAVLPLPEEIGGHKLLPSFYQQLVGEQHDVMERVIKKVGRGHKEFYETIGSCMCAVRGKMVYISGEVSHIPEAAKYLRLAITATSDIHFVFAEEGGVLSQTNFTVKEM